MTTVGIAMVRDELDILPVTLGHMLEQVDAVIVADNGSTDGTYEWLMEQARQLNGPLTVLDDREVGYYQSQKMSELAHVARSACHADWVVPFDADEVWLSRDGRRIADVLAELPEGVMIAEADLWDHVATGLDALVQDPNPVRRMRWRRPHPAPLPKVAVRPRADLTIWQGNHGATFDGIDFPGRVANLLTIRHFPYRSAEQTIRKVRNGAEAYAAAEGLTETDGAHWRGWGAILEAEGEDAIRELYAKWHYRADPRRQLMIDGELQPPLVNDPAPIRCPQPS